MATTAREGDGGAGKTERKAASAKKALQSPAWVHLSAAARVARGKEARSAVPRPSHAAVACGAANSARLLLMSANDQRPGGRANGSDQVGRNYIFHNSQAVLALSMEENPAERPLTNRSAAPGPTYMPQYHPAPYAVSVGLERSGRPAISRGHPGQDQRRSAHPLDRVLRCGPIPGRCIPSPGVEATADRRARVRVGDLHRCAGLRADAAHRILTGPVVGLRPVPRVPHVRRSPR